jgi:hypothetical protein
MKIQWNKVTWYSKLIAIVLFLLVFGLGIYVGSQIPDKNATSPSTQTISQVQAINEVSSLTEVKAYVSRVKAQHGIPHVASDNNIVDANSSNPYWNIHVYESLSDHDVTYAWYRVYINTGKVEKQ